LLLRSSEWGGLKVKQIRRETCSEWRQLPEALMPPMLRLKPAGIKGLGVFSLRRFHSGEIVERAPVIVLPDPQWQLLNLTALQHYYYYWDSDSVAIASGFGSFYNHSDTPNAKCIKRVDEQIMEWTAIRDIEADEEINIQYGCPVWFDAF
jgi:uncharacterized protein